jgi:hypothetical protein
MMVSMENNTPKFFVQVNTTPYDTDRELVGPFATEKEAEDFCEEVFLVHPDFDPCVVGEATIEGPKEYLARIKEEHGDEEDEEEEDTDEDSE